MTPILIGIGVQTPEFSLDRERACQYWEMIYIFDKFNPKNKGTERKYVTRGLKPKIDHKISSTKGPKEKTTSSREFNNRHGRNRDLDVGHKGHKITGGDDDGYPTQSREGKSQSLTKE
jgi:hypothetical protein